MKTKKYLACALVFVLAGNQLKAQTLYNAATEAKIRLDFRPNPDQINPELFRR